jgi:hypothetical protein
VTGSGLSRDRRPLLARSTKRTSPASLEPQMHAQRPRSGQIGCQSTVLATRRHPDHSDLYGLSRDSASNHQPLIAAGRRAAMDPPQTGQKLPAAALGCAPRRRSVSRPAPASRLPRLAETKPVPGPARRDHEWRHSLGLPAVCGECTEPTGKRPGAGGHVCHGEVHLPIFASP